MLATFNNGRIEEYLNAEILCSISLRSNYLEIVTSLAHLHNVPSDSPVMLWDRLLWQSMQFSLSK